MFLKLLIISLILFDEYMFQFNAALDIFQTAGFDRLVGENGVQIVSNKARTFLFDRIQYAQSSLQPDRSNFFNTYINMYNARPFMFAWEYKPLKVTSDGDSIIGQIQTLFAIILDDVVHTKLSFVVVNDDDNLDDLAVDKVKYAIIWTYFASFKENQILFKTETEFSMDEITSFYVLIDRIQTTDHLKIYVNNLIVYNEPLKFNIERVPEYKETLSIGCLYDKISQKKQNALHGFIGNFFIFFFDLVDMVLKSPNYEEFFNLKLIQELFLENKKEYMPSAELQRLLSVLNKKFEEALNAYTIGKGDCLSDPKKFNGSRWIENQMKCECNAKGNIVCTPL